MASGLTFDTGALIGLERRRQGIRKVFDAAVTRGWPITVPGAVIAEWWRGATDLREGILRAVIVEDTGADIAKIAGLALAAVAGATAIDAIVMASAALRGDAVYTSDIDDLIRLQTFFPAVRIFEV